jgi:hypothetical protein
MVDKDDHQKTLRPSWNELLPFARRLDHIMVLDGAVVDWWFWMEIKDIDKYDILEQIDQQLGQ